MKYTIELSDKAVLAKLSTMDSEIKKKLYVTIYKLTLKLRSHVVKDKLMGQVLRRVSGALGRSIDAKTSRSRDSVIGEVFSSGDVPYAAIHEYGGTTKAHVINATKAQALSFMFKGKQVIYRKVKHPGSKIPERSYMRSSLKDMRGQIQDSISNVIEEATK